ncbi:alpha/beta hydrolase [uncultured Kordia sp.]|uniref:alpha/beta fold hydrolase n=1 Tax=uncultured Kordia sp. TaxID=507699 RepID=UPI00262612F0|nr:alpha/beta hydrolase [uncultured Kordia sp.]
MKSFFIDIESKKEIINLYYKKLHELNIPHEFITIETSFGDTSVITAGQSKNQPLLLVHDIHSCAPIALEAMKSLIGKFRIYAIDVIGQPNTSAEIRLDTKNDDYGRWLYEIQSRLNIYNAYLVGISFGGFIVWKALSYDQSRISKAFLIAPVGIVKRNRIHNYSKVVVPLKLFQWLKNTKYLQYYMKHLFSEHNSFMEEYLSKVVLGYKMHYASISNITKKEAASIQIPLYIIAAKNDIFFPSKKLISKAKSIFPSLKEILFLKNAKHVPNKEEYHAIATFVKSNIND